MTNDDAYANAAYIPDAEDFIERWEERAVEFRAIEAAIGRARLNISYGAHERSALDLFLPAGRQRGLFFFVHGGYWRAFDRGYWAHLAAGAQALGWAVAIPSYTLAPEARIGAITRQVHDALVHAAGLVQGPIALAGHSAGGHLVSRLACKDVPLAPDLAKRIAQVIAISPLSDLRPLIDTAMNSDLQLDSVEAMAESPLLCTPRDVPVSVWVGAEERPAFHDQARWLCNAWQGATLHMAPGRHHFDIIDLLEAPDGPMLAPLRI